MISRDYLKRAYESLLSWEWLDFTEGTFFRSGVEWIEERRKRKQLYGKKFNINNLESLTEEDYIEFLYFKNNYAWTNLYRMGLKALNQFDKLKRTIEFLQNEKINIVVRIREVVDLKGKYHVYGVGKNIATAILHVTDKDDKYGVWNNVVERALDKIGILPRLSTNPGVSYLRINEVLNQIKSIIEDDLVAVDSLLWYILVHF